MKLGLRCLFLLGLFATVLIPRASAAQPLSDYGDTGEFPGVFRGVVPGKFRLSGQRKPFQGWVVANEKGQETVFAILEADDSVTKVAASPKAYVGRKCVVVWDQVEELPVGRSEPMDITRVRRVKWVDSSQGKSVARVAPDPNGLSMESVVRSFFAAIEDHDLNAVTQMLDDPVQYYQSRPMPRIAALSDIKGDWKRYADWHGEVLEFRSTDLHSCTFKLRYSLLDGLRVRSATMRCAVSFNPVDPARISKISATVVK